MWEPAITEIRAELEKIIASPVFVNSPRIASFLCFVVERAIAGQSAKEFEIGVEVFGKPPTFDPRLDSIVRVEARRLRQKLKAYYEQDGAESGILIEFREGSYLPAFCRRRERNGADIKQQQEALFSEREAIAVLPCACTAPSADTRLFCEMLTEDLIHACTNLLRCPVAPYRSTARFAHRSTSVQQIGRELNVALIIETTARKMRNSVWVRAQLIGTRDGFILSSRTYTERAANAVDAAHLLARKIVSDFAGAAGEPPYMTAG